LVGPISSDSKKLDNILKKIDRMGKRLDTLERSEKAPEKEISNTQYYLIMMVYLQYPGLIYQLWGYD
jgi:chaperonin cofactor prefoldin